ncbi:uncharacterized protein LOC144299726 [Canis aureus]
MGLTPSDDHSPVFLAGRARLCWQREGAGFMLRSPRYSFGHPGLLLTTRGPGMPQPPGHTSPPGCGCPPAPQHRQLPEADQVSPSRENASTPDMNRIPACQPTMEHMKAQTPSCSIYRSLLEQSGHGFKETPGDSRPHHGTADKRTLLAPRGSEDGVTQI